MDYNKAQSINDGYGGMAMSGIANVPHQKEAELDQGCHLLLNSVARLENAVGSIATVLVVPMPTCAENQKRPIPSTASHVLGVICEGIDQQSAVLEALTTRLQDVVGDIKILG